MSQNWYLLAFGVELGPMSWDDLCERAARGDLQPASQVRQGEAGAFVPAGEVPGLFTSETSEQPDEGPWYCEVLGSQLGPMSWHDLLALAERGTLRRDAFVRRGDDEWVTAESISGLFRASATAEEASHVATRATGDLFGDLLSEVRADPALAAHVTESDPPVSSDSVLSDLPPADMSTASPEPQEAAPDEDEPQDRQPDEPIVDTKPAAPVPTAPASIKDTRPEDTTPRKAKPAPASRPRKSRPRREISIPISGRSVAIVAVVLLIAGGGYAGWKLLPRWGSARPDYQQIAMVYRQVYTQIKQFREAPRPGSPAGLQFQFSRPVGALRNQVQSLSDDGTASKLADAGTQLSQMLANCQAAPDTAEGKVYVDSEQRFLSIIDSLPAGSAANR